MIKELHSEDLVGLVLYLLDLRRDPQQADLPTRDRINELSNQNPNFKRKIEHQRRMATFGANMRAFNSQEEGLMKKYPKGTHVAIWRGLPVLVGDGLGEVADEFYRQYGKQTVYVGRLGEEDIAVISSPVSADY